ncbi:MAG: FAD-dependent oxidoreductase [Thermodesulfovibrionales bacterium]|nr:FAD-dependent oxidoreductase [Thermodesulfovibrionales bacterium]
MALDSRRAAVVLGGGLTGLSAGYALAQAGVDVAVFEADSGVGGLSKTILRNGFRFDLGGHRFFTKDEKIEKFVKDLMGDELLYVNRKSKIYLMEKYFDYPLKPLNSILGLGLATTIKIVADYGRERLRTLIKRTESVSLEDWVVSNFGRTMFNLYFKQYSEKVWGIDCKRISRDWVAKRIYGLSLGKAIKNALFKFNGKDLPTLADRFLYPKLGIGRISERLKEEIERSGAVHTGRRVERISHDGQRIKSIGVRNSKESYTVEGDEFISSIPLTNLITALRPEPPPDVINAAASLGYRDLVIAAIMLNRPQVTDQTWIYVPEQKIPFGRIHEPKNWSPHMAPEDKTLLVIEYFCFRGDGTWNAGDDELTELTVKHLEGLGFIKKEDFAGSIILRVPKAYPLFEVGYQEHAEKIMDYLRRFKNLQTAGRGGMFQYYNMDHAIRSGMEAAGKCLARAGAIKTP